MEKFLEKPLEKSLEKNLKYSNSPSVTTGGTRAESLGDIFARITKEIFLIISLKEYQKKSLEEPCRNLWRNP